MRTSVKRHTSETIEVKDFNFLAEYSGSRIDVAFKRFVVSYQPMFSVSVEELPQLIEILTAMQAALKNGSVNG